MSRADTLDFGVFRLTPESRLVRNGRPIHLRPTERDFLAALVRARGGTVDKEALIAAGWGAGEPVSDASLARCAYTLRAALAAEDASSPYVETVYGEGYRLGVPVRVEAGDARVLVLPFRRARIDVGGDPRQLALNEGIIEYLGQSRLRGVSPFSAATSRHYLHADSHPEDVARELGADIVVSGRLSEQASSAHLDLRVHDVSTGRSVNVAVAAHEQTDVQAMAATAARALVSHLPVRGPRPDFPQVQSPVPRAYEAYLEGRYNLRHRTSERLAFAASRFEMALGWDPTHLPSLLGLLDCQMALGTLTLATGAEVLARTRSCLERASALAPGSRQVAVRRASVRGLFEWHFDEAVAMLKPVLDADGGDPDTLYVLARVLLNGGATEQAVELLEMVTELDPVSSSAHGTYASVLLMNGRRNDAVAAARRAAALSPNSASGWVHVSRCAAALGLASESLEAADRLKACDAETPVFRAVYAEVCARFGRAAEARELLATAGHRLAPSAFAVAAAALGDLPETRVWLQRALTERDCYLPYLRHDPLFEPARRDPGVAALLASVPQCSALD